MTTRSITTGELRAALQPVVFLHLLDEVTTVEGRSAFGKGTLVAAQYWGSGFVVLTSTTGEHQTVRAHDIKAALATPAVELQYTSE